MSSTRLSNFLSLYFTRKLLWIKACVKCLNEKRKGTFFLRNCCYIYTKNITYFRLGAFTSCVFQHLRRFMDDGYIELQVICHVEVSSQDKITDNCCSNHSWIRYSLLYLCWEADGSYVCVDWSSRPGGKRHKKSGSICNTFCADKQNVFFPSYFTFKLEHWCSGYPGSSGFLPQNIEMT